MNLGILPNPELIAKGFPDFFIGVEVKFYDLEGGGDWSARRKLKEALNQCISYKYSKFGSSKMEPAMVMLATNISTQFSKYSPKVVKGFDDATEDLRHFC
ncbi:hypothetical protein ACD591_10155 [Rufibacter glacialis]|uniref:Uncharacterized protein n=1 Tax=Rufibacter glacialis TaxID=1259555 RepID=A0A5M8Q9N6_9BACT|nr:hypothetical protein [Rufibacter glacialis]KAA6431868.1 hypothetical protein FOE74_17320 [Rufibacter glacialis]GGK80832.1 hypothetical protein GCM10011405_30750 [Rufibacter glacialis]